jgi:hypothetical protein
VALDAEEPSVFVRALERFHEVPLLMWRDPGCPKPRRQASAIDRLMVE